MKKIAIIGLGMIGGSIAAAAKRHTLCETITAYDLDVENLRYACDRGWIDADGHGESMQEVIRDADLVIVATPVDQCREVFQRIAEHLTDNQIITDVGSVKAAVVRDAQDALNARLRQFVPGHPIAGSEKSGAAAADEQLFDRQRVVLTPIPGVEQAAAVETVAQFWQGLGADIFYLDPNDHDRILAHTSHLPHAVAFAYFGMLSQGTDVSTIHRYIGGGFRDSSRLAASDLQMWRSVFLANSENVATSIGALIGQLERLKKAVEARNAEKITEMIQSANRVYHSICGRGMPRPYNSGKEETTT